MQDHLKIIIYFFCALFIFSSCNTNGYYFENRRKHFIKDKYLESKKIVVEDYILYSFDDDNRLSFRPLFNINSDSLYQLFKKSLNQLNLNSEFNEPHLNKVDSSFYNYSNRYIKYKHVKSKVKKLIKPTEGLSLIPIICVFYNQIRFASGAGADPYTNYICHLSIAIFITEGNDIIYFKHMRYPHSIGGEHMSYQHQDYNIPIPQEHWDGLVREVMREYIERLK